MSSRERLKKNDDIRRVFDEGVLLKGRLVSVFIRQETNAHTNRAAFIIKKTLYSKKTVLRNRFRRIIREAYRDSKSLLLPCCDIIILANRLDIKTKSTEVAQELKYAFKKYTEKRDNLLS